MTKRVSRAEMRRQREALVTSRTERDPLPEDLQRRAEQFEPVSLDDLVWAAVRPLFLTVIGSTSVRGADAFSKRCIALGAFLAWAQAEGVELTVQTVMRFDLIDTYCRSLSKRSAGSRRSHLRSLARDANPAGVPPPGITYEHNTVKAPYPPAEMAAIRRISLTQPTAAQRRCMCAVVGLARGAGLDAQDFRHLRRRHVEDRGDDGIWVHVQDPRPRLVPVRRQWEDMVRAGLDGLRPDDLVIGQSATRRNLAARVIEKATILGHAPKIEVSRLRTTWLADLLTDDVPLTVVMAVSGLTSARTITEILEHLDTKGDPGGGSMITPFNLSVIERAVEVVRRSGADVELLALISPTGRGRRPSYNTTAFLVGALLSVQWKGSLVIRDIHRVLTERLPVDMQRALGVRRAGAEGERLIVEKELYAITEAIGRYLEYGMGSAPDLDDAERERRRDALLTLLHRLLAVTLPESPSTSRAIDGTGIWSYGKAPRSAPKDLLKRDANGEPLHEDAGEGPPQPADAAAGDDGAAEPAPPKQPSDPDARYGVKTRKDGGRETYWGYELHALVRAPDRPGQDGFIPLFETFEVTPAGMDIVAPSLGLLDRSRDMGNAITDLLADRHYSYKAEDRWYFQLLDRDVRQHVDLHPNDQGFRDYNGMKLAAGWMHCPCTPDRLGRIDSPSPNADVETKKEFAKLIDERQQYAMRRVARLGSDSGARWECPALDGRVGCQLREGSVEVAQLHGLPVIVEPPDPASAPTCCTQRTVTTGRDAQPKVEQAHYWGGRKWKQRYNARTYVEGAFGNMKNPTTENVERGFFQITGLAKVNFMVGIALVAHNLRMLRGNTPLTAAGDGDLLIQEDADCHGFMFVSPQEEALILEMRAQSTAASATAA